MTPSIPPQHEPGTHATSHDRATGAREVHGAAGTRTTPSSQPVSEGQAHGGRRDGQAAPDGQDHASPSTSGGGPEPGRDAPLDPGIVDARVLVWLLLLVFATGLPLMLLFHQDAQVHAQRLQGWQWLRHLHAAASLAFVLGAIWHLVVRFGGSLKGVRTGTWLLISVGLATLSGGLAAQTKDAHRIAGALGGEATVVAAVAHVAYAAVLVLLTLYLHVSRWGWRQVFGDWRHVLLALTPAVVLAWLLPVDLPGGEGGGATALVAPPWPVLAAWPVVLGFGVWVAKSVRPKTRRGG